MNPVRFLRCAPVLGLLVAPVTVSTPSRADASRPRVWVHIDSPSPVQLQRHDRERNVWDVACDAPCDVALPLEDDYRVAYANFAQGGDHAKAGGFGETIRITGEPGAEVIVKVHPPSEAATIGGGALIGVGAVVGVAGLAGTVLFAVLAARTPSEPACSDGQATDGRDGGYTCGLGASIAGGLALMSGMIALGGAGLVAGGFALRAEGDARTTQKRAPTWRDTQVPGVPKPRTASLLTVHF
jgi:hypothetical protein